MNGQTGLRQSEPDVEARPETPPLGSAASRKASTARYRGKRIYARNVLSRDWWLMGPIMALSCIANVLFSMTLPPRFALLCTALAAVLASGGYWLALKERERDFSSEVRKLVVAGAVGVPMLLFAGTDADTLRHLFDAAAADLEESCERLIMGWRRDDSAMCWLALQSLDSLCDNFGAEPLKKSCGQILRDDQAIAALRDRCRATLNAVLATIEELDMDPVPET